MIITLQLAPGSAVSESDLRAHLGIGRTPIREALHRLARERLVAIFPRRGIIVSEIDIRQQLLLLETAARDRTAHRAQRGATGHRRRARPLPRRRGRIRATPSKANDDVTFMRVDREFNVLCSARRRTTSSPPAR